MIIFLFLLLFSEVTGQLLLSKRDISVPIGREVYIQPDDVVFHSTVESTVCKVEVINDEPMTQRVGTIIPQVFDCSFDSKTVKYVHRGSPLIWNDTVKFRVSEFLNHDTVSEYFDLFFSIQNSSYDVIVPLRPLVVKDFSGITHAIDNSVLSFNYSRKDGATCKIKMSRHFDLRPSHGQIVIGQENQPVDVIKRRCDEFLQLGLRYQHLKPPSPDIDFVSITVEVNDHLTNDIISEWYQIPVIIKPGFPNLPPKASFSGMYLMDVDQFIVTAITPTVLSAADSETPSSLLVFNISKPLLPHQGSIVHLSSDHSRAVSSFKQSDLNNFDIAYKPPSKSFKERQMFEIGFVISDPDFALSDPFTMHIAVRPAITTAPRVFMNVGLILLEGQSRPLRKENLEVVDADNIEEVKIFVTGGLHHGRLEVRGRPAYSFTQEDITSEFVVYHHDDSDTVRDSIHLRISDGIQSSHLKFPIVVIPKDDSPPSLVINTGLKVKKKEVQILSSLLRAADHDSLDEQIKFNVTRLPSFGEIWKRFAWEERGIEVSVFSQQDINRGLIYYRQKTKVLAAGAIDSFEIVLQDTNRPPNISPSYTVQVQVHALHNDSPPKQDPAASFHLQVVEEGEVGLLSSDNLHYMDDVDEDIIFTVTTPPRFIGSFAHPDPGKLVYLFDDVEEEYSNISAITSFTQRQVNHRKVAYVPPKGEIGPNPLFLQFIFSATDTHHNNLKGQIFNITVLPVNNQAPQIRTSELWVEEGSSTLVSTNEFSVYDPDTLSSDLQMSLFTVPLHGTLRRSNQLLRVGDLLSLDDILTLRLEYLHDGSENFIDGFKVGVNDGLHFVSGDVTVSVEPVDDEKPMFTKKELPPRISVSEGGSTTLTSDLVSASDVDTKSESLFFIVTEMPTLGSIFLNGSGKAVHRFNQKSLLHREVSYVHNNQEVGPNPKEDSFTLIVTDKMFPSSGPHDSLKVLVTVLPSNSQPPRLLFKRTLLVEEGQRTPVTEDNIFASDEDTFPSELLVMIVRQPRYGYLENSRPALGYEAASTATKKISAFPLQDVTNRFISFVQYNHSAVEPESDDFEICVTDGVHNSSSVLVFVSIILVNDEVPQFYLSNVTVNENGLYVLDSDSIMATDKDYPGDILLLSVSDGPEHGTLTYFLRAINNGPMLEIPFNQMAFENFDKIVYHHDGTETRFDSFTLSINDGLHTVDQTCHVTILPVNDQPPRLSVNLGAQKLNLLGYFTFNDSILFAEDPDGGDNHNILYKILHPPQYGVIEEAEIVNATTTYWQPLGNNFTFSQEDIHLNRIRYRHTDTSGSNRDNFTFYLTDGELNSTLAVFEVELINNLKKQLTINISECIVEHGSQALIDSSVLYAFDSVSDPNDIHFSITKPPLYGSLTLDSNTSVENFTAFHLLNGRLSYKHNESHSKISDSFSVSVTNGVVERYFTFNIVIIPQTSLNKLPTSNHLLHQTSLKNLPVSNQPSQQTALKKLPVLNHSLPLILGSRNKSVIASDHLLSFEPSLSPSEIIYFIREFPKMGHLLLSENVTNPTSFTQRDINMGLVSFSPNSGASGKDRFFFLVSNRNKDDGFLLNGRIVHEPAVFEIFIKPEPVVVVKNLTYLESVWNDKVGFEVSRDHLRVEGAGVHPRDIWYHLSKDLEYGLLYNRKKEAPVVGEFSQEDIDEKWLIIILKKKKAFTRDHFAFYVSVNGSNMTEQTYRLYLEWSVVHFVYSEYSVCEDEGTVSLPLRRIGLASSSSNVSISIKEITAVENLDFVSNTRVIQFDSGVTDAFWKIVIVKDDERESPYERLQLTLSQPQNCLIFNSSMIINIYDFNTNSCTRLPLKRWKEYTFNNNDNDEEVTLSNGSTQVDDGTLSDIIVTTMTTPLPKECPEGWQKFGGKCYKWYRPATSWSKAQTVCEEQPLGSLVTVDSQDHNNWLVQLARTRPFWIGYDHHQSDNENRFTNWKRGGGGSSRHRCVLVRGSGIWINKNCEANQSFICETLLT